MSTAAGPSSSSPPHAPSSQPEATPVTAQSHSSKATAALVLGILGLVVCPLICSVLALVFGYQGRREIDAAGGRMSGRGNATAGIVLGWIGVAFCVLFILLVIVGVLAGDSGSSGHSSPGGVPA